MSSSASYVEFTLRPVQSPIRNSQLPSILVNCYFTSTHRRIDLQTGRILFSSSPSPNSHHQRRFHPQLLYSPDLFCANLYQFLSCSPDLDHHWRVLLADAIGCFISELPPPLFHVDAFIQIVQSEFVYPTPRQHRPSFRLIDGVYVIDAVDVGGENGSISAMEKFIQKQSFECGDERDEECSICFENYGKDGKAVKTECNHVFHQNCISKWLLNNNTCPLCRKRVF